MSVENMGNGYVKVGVKQEDLEASIAGLRQLKPILQAQVTRGNGNNTRQAAIYKSGRRIYHTSDTRGDIRDSGATHRTGIKRMFYDAT